MSLENNALTNGKSANISGTLPGSCAETVPRQLRRMYKVYAKAIETAEARGEDCAKHRLIAMHLWACTRNDPVPPTVLEALRCAIDGQPASGLSR